MTRLNWRPVVQLAERYPAPTSGGHVARRHTLVQSLAFFRSYCGGTFSALHGTLVSQVTDAIGPLGRYWFQMETTSAYLPGTLPLLPHLSPQHPGQQAVHRFGVRRPADEQLTAGRRT